MKGALPYPFYSINTACLEGIVLVRPGTATDKPYNPLMPTKLWADVRPNLPVWMAYTIIQVVSDGAGNQKSVLQPITLTRAWAQSFNIPWGTAMEGPPGEPELPFPVRPLFDDEELVMNPWGTGPVICNKVLYAALMGGSPAPTGNTPADVEILGIVKDIQTRLIKGGL